MLSCVVLVAASARASDAVGRAFLASHAAEDGVISLPSGLQYKPLYRAVSESAKQCGARDKCTVHFEGTLIDGTVFDSSRQRGGPATFSPAGVIAGWAEALQLMQEGDRWQLVVPSEVGYRTFLTAGQLPRMVRTSRPFALAVGIRRSRRGS